MTCQLTEKNSSLLDNIFNKNKVKLIFLIKKKNKIQYWVEMIKRFITILMAIDFNKCIGT